MNWEYLGPQDLRASDAPNRGHVYRVLLWRTRVPGGWLVVAINERSSNPDPVTSFYPDPDHTWKGTADPNSKRLLRPAAGAGDSAQPLLRAATPPPVEAGGESLPDLDERSLNEPGG